MRAHCTNIYADDVQEYVGDIWISAPTGALGMTVSMDDKPMVFVKLSETNARDMRNALDSWLVEYGQTTPA